MVFWLAYRGLLAESERIAYVVGDLPDVLALVCVGQNADIVFFFQSQDFVLERSCCIHINAFRVEGTEVPKVVFQVALIIYNEADSVNICVYFYIDRCLVRCMAL